jgi:sugar phosphate permease
VVKNPTTKFITMGGTFRHFSDAIIAAFLPVFFLRTYPGYKAQYAALNALILTFGGFTSNLLAGLIGDRFEKKYPMVKGWITCLSTIFSLPMMLLACAGHGNFYISIGSIAAYVLLSGGYHSTAVTMIENSVST